MTRILVIGDVHQSDSAPSRRSDTYTEDVNNKLVWLAQQAKDKDCGAITLLGDTFHIKNARRNSHRLVQMTHESLTHTGVPVILTVGNHDVSNDRLDSLDKQPLGALGRMTGCEVLVGKHDTLPIFAIPYLQDWQTLPGWIDQYKAARKGDQASTWLLTMHAPIFPDGQNPPYDYISGSTMAKFIDPYDTLLAYGHIHDPHGVYNPVDGVPVRLANLGAISRGSLHIETLKRKPQAYIWDDQSGGIEVLDIPHRPVEEIFPLQEVNAAKAQSAGMTAFLEGVGSGAVDATNVDSVMVAAREAKLGSEVESVVLSLLTSDE